MKSPRKARNVTRRIFRRLFPAGHETISTPTSLTSLIKPGPLPLFRTASDGKLGGAWERGYYFCINSNQ